MGITIHYSGRARDYKSLTTLMNTAQLFAAQRGWMFAMFDDPLGDLEDRDPDDPGYIADDRAREGPARGPLHGIVLRPHPKCEPVRLTFNAKHELEGFTKTQFAPFHIHKQVVQLLREVEPFMETLTVIDESGLWETGDEAAALQKFNFLSAAINGLAGALEDAGLEVDGPGVLLDPDDPYAIDDPDDPERFGSAEGPDDDPPPSRRPRA